MRNVPLLAVLALAGSQAATAQVQEGQAPDARLNAALASPEAGFDDGFFVCSPDRAYQLTIGGRMQFDAELFDQQREPDSNFEMRRMRLELTGRFPHGLQFHFEPNFASEGLEIEESWLGVDMLQDNARLMFGRMKAPFTLEERSKQANIDFPRFSILHQFDPQEDEGVFLYGRTPSQALAYDVAVYNGTGGTDTNGSKDVAARVVAYPFVSDAGSPWQSFLIGVAATYGDQELDVTGDSVENELKLPVIEYASGVELDGPRTRIGLQSAWYRGPWFAQAEVAHIEQDMRSAGGVESIGFDGAYFTLSHVLTGEAKSFDATHPSSPFDFETGAGRGAWIVAARYSDLRSDSDLESGAFVVPGTFTDSIRTVSLGLNWVPHDHVIVRNAFVHTWYSDEIALDRGSDDAEDAYVFELQLSF